VASAQPEGQADNTDIITEWGKKITPESVKTVFEYPRPQMVRSSFTNLNGLWEFKAVEAGTSTNGAFGKTLNETILVPFPVESCLSGLRDVNDTNGVPPTYQHMWYRTTVSQDQIQGVAGGRTLLHFGAVDWQTDVYVNGLWVGSNTGGYNAFSFDITEVCLPLSHSLCLYLCLSVSVSLSLSYCLCLGAEWWRRRRGSVRRRVRPLEHGPTAIWQAVHQSLPHCLCLTVSVCLCLTVSVSLSPGKQRISARYNPGGDTYTPNSGIWQTVWMESVPDTYIEGLKINADMKQLTITVNTNVPDGSAVTVQVKDGAAVVATSTSCKANLPCVVAVPSPKLWSPESPFLYNMTVTAGDDSVDGYFGMREVKLGKDAGGATRPMINGKFRFLAGFLDQSWWPDGQYLAPGDEALASDVVVLKTWGMNMIRLHQKVNPQRWYYAADKAGIVILQDMVQHYGDGAVRQGGLPAEARYYWSDLKVCLTDTSSLATHLLIQVY
jgi:beta-galactosidase/beta-glucuronidase